MTRITRTVLIACAAALGVQPQGLLAQAPSTGSGQAYPAKPIRVIVPFGTGGPADIYARFLGQHMQGLLGQSCPAKSVKELVALAKKTKGGMSYSSSGTGTPYHMAGELFKALAGVDILHVPHKSSGDARTSVMSGQTDMMLDAITTMLPIAQAGRVRALATSGRTRSSVSPDLPTIAEAGVEGYETTIWIGVVAPAGTHSA